MQARLELKRPGVGESPSALPISISVRSPAHIGAYALLRPQALQYGDVEVHSKGKSHQRKLQLPLSSRSAAIAEVSSRDDRR
jgi:hypothetical protein